MSDIDDQGQAQPEVDLEAREFQDYDGALLPSGFGFDLSRLFTAESLRGIAAAVVAVLVLATPGTSPRAFAVLVGVILIVWALGGLAELRSRSKRTAWTYLRTVVLALAGVSLILYRGFTGEGLGRLIGAGLIAYGLLIAVRGFRNPDASRLEAVLGTLVYVALGGALLVAPLAILGLAVLLVSIYWFVTGIVTVITNVRLDDRQISTSNTWQMLLEWVQTRPNTADDRQQLYEKIFFEGAEHARRLSRFFVLMGFATAIAAFGVIADSTAVVIGAMLVAPLMTPLMGTSLAMAMGWPRRAMMSAAVALAGILFAIGLSIMFGWVYGPDISTVTNSQVASRIAPTLVDLMIAIAAGGAGAFALSRPDVSDSLPGVAVAIALVPPLAVVGLMVSQNSWEAASGAMLLFVTNLVAIILFGGLVFILTGVVPILRMFQQSQWVKKSLGMVGILAIGVVAILGVSAQSFRRQTAGLAEAAAIVDEWIAGTDLSVSSSKYVDDQYRIVLEGSEVPPPIEDLATAIEDQFGESIAIEVTWVPTQTFSAES